MSEHLQRQAAATDAGSECAWVYAGRPSVRSPGMAALNAQMLQLGRLAYYRDDAACDPAAFVAAFFDAIDNAIMDASDELAEHRSYQADPEAFYGVSGEFMR